MSKSFASIKNQYTLGQLVKKTIREQMQNICMDDIMLAEVVAAGEKVWRETMKEMFAPLDFEPSNELCDRVFLFFCGAIQAKFGLDQDTATAAITAEPIAKPLVTALVVLPTASSGSVTLRTSSGMFAISAMPPALSVIGP